ncbi:ATP-binding protein [Nocardioides sp. YJ-D4]
MVTLTGPGGVGKSRLAYRLLEAHPVYTRSGVTVELANLRDAELVARTVATAFGISDTGSKTPLDLLAEHLQDRAALLYLDNCEHLLDAVAEFVIDLLARVPRIRVLASSRQPLGVPGERVLPVQPLSVPSSDPRLIQPADTYDAMVLFEHRARAVVPDFALNDDNRDDVAQICRHLDGIPLAIELAAVRLRALGVSELASRLGDAFDLLTSGGRLAPERHQTLRATIDWSYDLCTEAEQTMWARASVFAGGFGLLAAETVCAGGPLASEDVLDALAGLVEKSVLSREEVGGRARFRMLETVREYGQARLAVSGEESALRERHRSWVLDLLDQARRSWFGPEQEAWSQRLRLEYPNLRTAFEFSLGRAEHAPATASAIGRAWYLWVCVLLAEGRVWLTRATQVSGAMPSAKAEVLAALGYVAALQGDAAEAEELAIECRRVADDLDDARLLAYSEHIAGLSALFTDPVRATSLLSGAVRRYADAGAEPELRIGAEIQLGLAHIFTAELDAARVLFEGSERFCISRGEDWERSYAQYGRGFVELADDRPAEAIALTLNAIRTKYSFRDVLGLSLTFDLLSWARAAEGSWVAAAKAMGAAHTSWASFGHQLFHSKHWLDRRRASETQIRDAIGDAGFEAAFETGRSLPIADFVQQVLAAAPNGRHPPDAELTRRELQIAGLVAHGRTNREIATELHISQRTVEAHLENAFSKLGFNRRAQLAAWISARPS